MERRRQLFLLHFLLVSFAGSTQSVSNKTINAAGNSVSTPIVFLEYSIGESFVGQGAQNNYLLLTHGFLQPSGGTVSTPLPVPQLPVNSLFYGIDNAGNSVNVNNVFLESTLGEWMAATRTGGNLLITEGILQPYPTAISLPVNGLEFFAKRISKHQVQLDWKTLQEFANKGFHIERKKENENGFNSIVFISSKGQGGNSSFPLTYQQLDTNIFSGKTYYRLKQQDVDGKIVYSVVRLIHGEVEKHVILKAWPVPAPREFTVSITGIEADVIQVYDASGKLIKQTPIQENEHIRIAGLPAGIYFIKLKKKQDLTQKITVL